MLRFASCSVDDRVVKLWDLHGFSVSRSFLPTDHATSVTCMRWNQNGELLACTSHGTGAGTISISSKDGVPLFSLDGGASKDRFLSCAFSQSGAYLVTGADSGNVSVWDLRNKKFLKPLKAHPSAVTCIEFHATDHYVACACANGDLYVHNLATSRVSPPMCMPSSQGIQAMQYSPFRQSRLAVTGDDGLLGIWDTNTYKPYHLYADGHSAPATCLAHSPFNKELILTGGLDKRIIFWHTNEKKKLNVMPVDTPVTSLVFADNANTILVGGSKGTVSMYDLRNNTVPVHTSTTHQPHRVTCLAVVPQTKASSQSTRVPSTASSTIRKATPSTLDSKNPPSTARIDTNFRDRTHSLSKQTPSTGGSVPRPGIKSDGIADGLISPLKTDTPASTLPAGSAITRPPTTGSANPIPRPSTTTNRIPRPTPSTNENGHISRPTRPPDTVANGQPPSLNSLPRPPPSTDPPPLDSHLISGLISPRKPPSRPRDPSPPPPQQQLERPPSAHTLRPKQPPATTNPPAATPAVRTISPTPQPSSTSSQLENGISQSTHSVASTIPRPPSVGRQEKTPLPPQRRPTPPTQVPPQLPKENVGPTEGKSTRPPSMGTQDAVETHTQTHTSTRTLPRPPGPVVDTSMGLPAAVVQNMIDDALERFRSGLHSEIQAMHLDMLRQFHVQRGDIESIVREHSINEALLAEVVRLREENERLRHKH